MTRHNKLILLEFILVAGFVSSLIFHYQVWARSNASYPFSTFLCDPKYQFAYSAQSVHSF